MSWTTPRTWVATEVVTATLMNAHVRDNLAYLMTRPQAATALDIDSQFTTTASTFAAIHSSVMALSVTPAGTRVLLGFTCVARQIAAGDVTYFTIYQNGTALYPNAVDGFARTPGVAGYWPISFTIMATGLTSGTKYTYRVCWKTDNTGILYAGTAGAGINLMPNFWALEVG